MEEQIAARLAQSIPTADTTPVTPVDPPVGVPNQADTSALGDIDELTQYKLHDLFGEPYKANDETKRQQLSYIYEQAAQMVESTDYGFVAAKIRELEGIMGITHSEDKIYKMYQWLRLNNVRKNIEAEMGAISG